MKSSMAKTSQYTTSKVSADSLLEDRTYSPRNVQNYHRTTDLVEVRRRDSEEQS